MSWLCLRCRAEVEPSDNLSACPACGARGVPADTADRVTVTVTWHELRVLIIWAERWASDHAASDPDMRKVVYGIADALQLQHLDKHALTFAGELSSLRGDLGLKVEQNVIPEDRP